MVCYYSPLQIYNHNHLTSLCNKNNAYLSVKLTNLQPIDLVLVVSPRGPHLELLKQAMVLVTFSLRSVDRLAIVMYSARVFPLRRMTSCAKRAALRVIDRHFSYMGQSSDPSQGILKGIKVVRDRAYKNPRCSILDISTSPIRSHSVMQMGVMVHRFHAGYGNGFVMHKLEELLEKKVLGGGGGGVAAKDIQLRIGIGMEMEGQIVRIGELRGGEERQLLLDLHGVHVNLRLCYSYAEVEGDINDDARRCIRRRGETTLSLFGIKRTGVFEVVGDYMNTITARRKHQY